MKPASPSAAPSRETGWLPDFVYIGEKFEAGLAFFADGLGRITRFSREPADLTAARRLEGRAAVPGLVNGHSRAILRAARGRSSSARVLATLTDADVYDVARMAFLEMLLSGITCIGEFHALHHQPDGTPWPDPNRIAHEVLRAAHDVGLRIALFKVASVDADALHRRSFTATAAQFVREMDALKTYVAREHPGDETWLGVGVDRVRPGSIAYVQEIAAYAHAQRYRLQIPMAARAADHAAWLAEANRPPVQLLAERGLIDKRVTAIHAIHVSDEEVKLLGAARAMVCACPTSESGLAPVDKLLAAGVGVALGTGSQVRCNLLEEARQLARHAGAGREDARAWLYAATVAGARSLGAPSGALEVGRPADFFTVNIYDPSIAGAGPDTLLEHVMFSVERRAISEVWMGAKQRLASGRHLQQGPIVGRFVDLQRRLPEG